MAKSNKIHQRKRATQKRVIRKRTKMASLKRKLKKGGETGTVTSHDIHMTNETIFGKIIPESTVNILIENCSFDTIDVSKCANTLVSLTVYNNPVKSVGLSSIVGLELCEKLRSVKFYDVNIDGTLDLSKINVESFDITNSTINELIVLNPQLQTLKITFGKLTDADLTSCLSLFTCDLSHNELKTISLPNKIKSLYLFDNMLTTVDASRCDQLSYVDVAKNKLGCNNDGKKRDLKEKILGLILPENNNARYRIDFNECLPDNYIPENIPENNVTPLMK